LREIESPQSPFVLNAEFPVLPDPVYDEDDTPTLVADLLLFVKQGNDDETGDATDRLGIGEARITEIINLRLLCFSVFCLL
jgi:hypothetical protein